MFLKNKKYLFDGGSGQTLMEMGLETTGDLWSAQALLNENNQLKIDNDKISRPFILGKSLFVVKDNAIIKLD